MIKDTAKRGGPSRERSNGVVTSDKEEVEEEEESEESSESEDKDEDNVVEEEDDIQSSTVREAASIPAGDVSRRLAVVNLDWDHIRAVDLMAVFGSYASAGAIEGVVVYPSEFGRERMEREEMEGPPRGVFGGDLDDDDEEEGSGGSSSDTSDDGDQEDGEEEEEEEEEEDERIRKSLQQEDAGEEFSSTKLRNYQLERLRYYYAVVTCTTLSIAKDIYDNIDGREYLSTANFFDLRFIPDEMDFSSDTPREECSKIPAGYRPNEFVTAALQHSKVKLTWDADDGVRKDIQQRAFTGSRKDLDENELRAYLASDHSSDEDDGKNNDDDEGGGVEIVDSTMGIISSAATTTTATATKEHTVRGVDPGISKAETRRLALRAKLGLADGTEEGNNTNGVRDTRHVPVGEMKVTFTPGLSTTVSKSESVFENEPVIDETTAEKYIRKERERKARRKEKSKAERTPASETIEEEESQKKKEDAADQGFDDSFFTATPAEAEALAEQKKIDKRKERRARRAAEEKAAQLETAELKRALGSDSKTHPSATGTTDVRHFSLSALEKAEKALKKQKLRKGKSRLSQSEKAALEAKANDVFEMDVEDKRFAAVYERPEFALDPSNPRFRETAGMKVLLNEARDRRKRQLVDDDATDDTKPEDRGNAGSSKKSRKMIV